MPFFIHADFPGGNIAVDSAEGEVFHLSPDLRDTTTPWFYWYFGVTGAAGKTLTFVFDPKNMGVRGPAVSLDAGQSWRWLGADSVKEGAFSYSFPKDTPGASDVRFSVGMPYVRANWDRFLAAHRANPYLQTGTLTRTPQGREVPLLFVGEPVKKAPFCVALTGRHHACEMMASYVLEGVIEGALADDATGQWLRENTNFFIVPFMDADGVERGDQGKNRAPHDHNRDYWETPIYSEVRALKERLPAWAAGRPLVSIDLHCPALFGPVHESIFLLEPADRAQAARLDQLSEALWRAHRGAITVQHPNKLAYGAGFNADAPAAPRRTNSAWASALPCTLLGISLEIAYANAIESEVNADSARELGRSLAMALKNWLQASQKS